MRILARANAPDAIRRTNVILRTASLLAIALAIAIGSASARAQTLLPARNPTALQAAAQSSSLQGLLIACLVDHFAQGLSVPAALEACMGPLEKAIELGEDHTIDSVLGETAASFDPGSIVAACASIDPREAWAPYSLMTDEQVYEYMEAAKQLRELAAKAGLHDLEKYWDNEATEAFRELDKRCPSGCPGVPRTVPDEIAGCAQALATAREILRECARTNYQGPCVEFGAKLRGCPNPLYAYVDPSQGLVCEEEVDPNAVVTAWRERCEQRTTPGPEGGSPCTPPEPPEGGVVAGGATAPCSDPRAMIDPASDACFVPLQVMSPDGVGGTSVEEVILVALQRLGGPIFVLPPSGPSPFPPGPDPAPSPGP